MRDRLIAGDWVAGPIDLIPEFLPIIGPLDDIVVVAPASRLAMPIPVTPPVSHRCCTPASVGDGGKSGLMRGGCTWARENPSAHYDCADVA